MHEETTDFRKAIQLVTQTALDEIEKYGTPSVLNFETANRIGQELAEKHNVHKETVLLGTMLMDIKIGECLKEDKLDEHIDRSMQEAKRLLTTIPFSKEDLDKVLNCIEAHHAQVPFTCKEAEIVANADCYRFLLPKNALYFFHELMAAGKTTEDAAAFTAQKVQEKHDIMSLPDCKQQLEPNYQALMEVLNKV